MPGSPKIANGQGDLRGSIPAGAGEPGLRMRQVAALWVYPRGCGGAMAEAVTEFAANGLSPRVRGSLSMGRKNRRRAGSIPAGAGEPIRLCPLQRRLRVYPRGCGGADWICYQSNLEQGLSPRVRGSRPNPASRTARAGSIPAGAGEPIARHVNSQETGVYPRGCGGACSRRRTTGT